VGKMAVELMTLANEDKKKKTEVEVAANEQKVVKKNAQLKYLEGQLKSERTALEDAEQTVLKRKEEVEQDKAASQDDSQARAAASMLTQKATTRMAEQRLATAREDLSKAKEKQHKDQTQLQEYVDERTGIQSAMSQMKVLGDETGGKKKESELKVLERLEEGARQNVQNNIKAIKTLEDALAVAQEEMQNFSRQLTLENQKVLDRINNAKAQAESSVSKAMQDENKQAAQIVSNKPPVRR